jgi:hypothetical protein
MSQWGVEGCGKGTLGGKTLFKYGADDVGGSHISQKRRNVGRPRLIRVLEVKDQRQRQRAGVFIPHLLRRPLLR